MLGKEGSASPDDDMAVHKEIKDRVNLARASSFCCERTLRKELAKYEDKHVEATIVFCTRNKTRALDQ